MGWIHLGLRGRCHEIVILILQAICQEALDYQQIEETRIAQNQTQIIIEFYLQIFNKFLARLSLEIFYWERRNLGIELIIYSQKGVLQVLMQSFKLFILLF